MQDGVPGERSRRRWRTSCAASSRSRRRSCGASTAGTCAASSRRTSSATWRRTTRTATRRGCPGACACAIAFADLAGYTRMTEELGDEEAVLAVERFIEEVERSLPVERARREDDRRRGHGRRVGRRRDHRLGGRLPGRPRRPAPAAAHRAALRGGPLPRRRVLRPRGEPRGARRGARGRRRGARDPRRRRGRGQRPGPRAHRRGAPEGLRRRPPSCSSPTHAGDRSRSIASAPPGSSPPGAPVVVLLCGGRDSVCLLDVAVRIAGADAVDGAARQPRAARRGVRRRRGATAAS